MSMVIKLLGAGVISTTAPGPLYTVPASALGAIVNNIRIVNTGSSVDVNIYLRSSSTDYRISDTNKTIAANTVLLLKPELTMAPLDEIKLVASVTPTLDFVICGTEQY